jgi:uncharacterized membrane protein
MRTIAKTLTWRIVGSSSTFAIAFIITGEVGISSGIVFVQMIVNTILYYLHEKVWIKING